MTQLTLLDGGFGRELQEQGIPIDTDLWSAEVFYRQPKLVQKIHEDFINAGAEVIITNTYAITRYNLEKAKKWHDRNTLLKLAYQAALDAKAKHPHVKVAGSLPPLTETYRPDLVDRRRLKDEYKFLFETALTYGADIILGETLSTQQEVQAICDLISTTDTPVWISFTVGDDGNLRSGESLTESAELALDAGAKAILVNCSDVYEVDQSMALFQKLNQRRPFVFGCYPNRFMKIRQNFTLASGLNDLNDEVTPEVFVAYCEKWHGMGATVLGGCCGIGPGYIETLSKQCR